MCKNRICDIINLRGVGDMDYPTMEDIEIINVLRRAELMIQDIYQDLKSLELSCGIGSNTYLKKLDDLKNAIFLEGNLFEIHQAYFMYIDDLLDEIMQNTDEIESKLVTSDSELANVRINNKVSKIFVDLGIAEEVDIAKKRIKIGNKIDTLMFSLLNQKIGQISNFELKKKVATIKYNSIYTYGALESKLLKQNMKTPSPEKCIEKLKKYRDTDLFHEMLSETYNYNFELLLHYRDYDISTQALVIYLLNVVKTTLLLIPEEIVEQLYENYRVEKEKSSSLYTKNPKIMDDTLQMFEEVREERKHYQK